MASSSKVNIFLISLLIGTIYSQNNFLVETSVTASFKMGSMKTETQTLYTQQDYFSKVKFSFKGKGVARLMSRDMHNGIIISFEDSTIKKIDYKKKKYTSNALDEILKDRKKEKNDNQNEDIENDENIMNTFTISENPEIINGFKTYKLTIDDKNSTEVWFTEESIEPMYVKKMKEDINKFVDSFFNISGSFNKYGINENAIIIKLSSSSEGEGNFNYNIITHKKINEFPEKFLLPKKLKKVKKL